MPLGGNLIVVMAGPGQGITGAAQVRPVELGGGTVLPKLSDFGGNGVGGQFGRGSIVDTATSIFIFIGNIAILIDSNVMESIGGSPIPHGPQRRQVLPSPSSAGGELPPQHDGSNVSSTVTLGRFQRRLFGLCLLRCLVLLIFTLLLPGNVGTARLRLGHPIGVGLAGPNVVNLAVHVDHLAEAVVVDGLVILHVASIRTEGGTVDVCRVRLHHLRVPGLGLGLRGGTTGARGACGGPGTGHSC